MVDIVSTVNPNYQKSIDAVSRTRTSAEAESAEKETASTETQENVDTYVPEDKNTVEEDAGTTYKPNAALVQALKDEQAANQERFISMMKSMLNKQGKVFGESTDYTVSEEVQAAAKEAISEDGYWGVKQTSERMVSFAKALVGGDPSRVGEMRDAFIKGYEAAAKAWGGELPSIARETYDAAMKLFDEWEKEGKQNETDQAVQEAPKTGKTEE
ncbi:MAG: hypothetical protein HDT14_00295 [Oscillibacter sp.]|nr:hypothetical protein [Oscillibacter sp.]